MIKWFTLILIALHLSLISTLGYSDRLKDLTSIAGIRSNQLVGYGIVVGLNGTGDGNIGLTLQSMQSMVSRFGNNDKSFRVRRFSTSSVKISRRLIMDSGMFSSSSSKEL